MPTCPQCNAPLPFDAPAGLCPACLLNRGLEPNTVPEISNLKSQISNSKSSSAWMPPSPEQLAPFFPDLDTLSLLGRGGMGAVYKARQKSLDRIIALKILPPEISHDPNFAQRFTHEAQALARLNHPHIVTIYDYGTREFQVSSFEFQDSLETRNPKLETLHFLSMEFIDGLSLRQLLNAHTLTPNDALAIVPQICDALQYAHDRGIVHRDIKPENILLTKTGQIKIADFGLAKLIDLTKDLGLRTKDSPSEAIAGTPQYMSPEQTSSPDSVDHRADIYALGVVFYQMLTGELPPNPLTAPSTKVHIDVRLDEIVLRALQQNPEARYQNATQFKTEIETVINTPPTSSAAAASPPSATARADVLSHSPALTLTSPPPFDKWKFAGWGGLVSLAIGCIVWLVDKAGLRLSPTTLPIILLLLFITTFVMARILIKRYKRLSQSPPPPRGGYNAPSSAADPSQPPPTPRLSRLALLGALWAPCFLLAFLLFMHVTVVTRPGEPVYTGPPLWLSILTILAAAISVSAPFGTTIGGIISLSQIRRSDGQLYGLPLALFDALLFPLLALDALIAYLIFNLGIAFLGWTRDYDDVHNSQLIIATILVSVTVDAAIAVMAWRALRPKSSPSATARADVPSPPAKFPFSRILVISALIVTLISITIMIVVFLSRGSASAASADIHYRVFEAPAELVDRMIDPLGRQSAELPDPDATPKSRFSGSPFTASTQTVEVPDTIVTSILRQAQEFTLGVLVERERHVDFWPRVADSWSYSSADPKFFGSSGGNLMLGVRNEHHQLQLHVEGTLTHTLNTAIVVQSYIMWHGGSPTKNSARLFLTPFTRKTGEAEYLIVDYELADSVSDPSPGVLVPPSQTSTPENPFKPRIVPLAANLIADVPGGAYSRTLASGVTVELVGVSHSPSDHALWWRPDGSPLPVRPYNHIGGSVAPYPHALSREFLVHLTHLPTTTIDTQWKFDPDCSSAGGGPLVVDERSHNELCAIAVLVPETPPFTIHFGVASGPWNTIAEDSPQGSAVAGVDKGSVMFSPAFDKNGSTQISVAYNLIKGSIRLIAIDTSGSEHTAVQSTGGIAGEMSQLNVTFADLPLEKIQIFRLQSRPIEWAEFKNVAINPAP